MEDYYPSLHARTLEGTVFRIPRREFDLIEFYKKVKEDERFDSIIGISLDETNHTIIFHVTEKVEK